MQDSAAIRPPEWDEEVFEKVMEQAENFKAQGTYEYSVVRS